MYVKPLPSAEALREKFDYDPESGILTWRTGRRAGCRAGQKNGRGYMRVKIGQTHYRVHRVVWVWWYGEIDADLQIDHIDRNPSNNRISNLRLVTGSVNCRNTSRAENAELRRREKERMQKGAFIGIAKYAIITYPDGSVIEVPTIERAAQVLGVKSVGTILRAGQGQAFRFDRLKGITVKVGERYVINERTKKKIKTKKKLTKTTRRIRRGG